jgi:hypothetical protein
VKFAHAICRDNNLDHVGIVVANDTKLFPQHN